MKPKVLTAILAVILLVAVGARLILPTNEKSSVDAAAFAGEVTLTSPDQTQTLQAGHTPPDFFIVAEDGSVQALSAIKDQYIFINFWDIGCPPCRDEMPDLHKLYQEYKNKNITFAFIHAGVQDKQLVEAGDFLKQHQYTLPVYLDRSGDIFRSYGIRGIPTTIVINPQGELVYAASGQISYDTAQSLIEEAN